MLSMRELFSILLVMSGALVAVVAVFTAALLACYWIIEITGRLVP